MKLSQHISQGRLVYLSNDIDQISINENAYYRWLMFDDVIQSIMHLRSPEKLTLPHQYAALMPLLFFKPKQIVELGLGGGNLSRFLSALHVDVNVTSVELSATVIHCFKEYFNPLQDNIVIKNESALAWLESHDKSEKKLVDWFICDVYQHHADSFQNRVKLLSALIDNLQYDACLTLNLPDLADVEVDLCLTILRQLQDTHQIIYFHIPRYLNVVIHLLPKHWSLMKVHAHTHKKAKKRAKATYLPEWQYSRWSQYFGKYVDGAINIAD